MDPESGFDGILRIGEVLTFDAVGMASGSGEELTPEVRQFAGEFDFTLVRLPLNIRPRADTTVRFVAVEIDLGPHSATCWAADPERVEEELSVTSTLTVGGSLKPKLAEISTSRERAVEYVIRRPRVTAFGVGMAEVAWEFSPTPGHALQGVQMLHCVVKSPTGVPATGVVRMRADIVSRGLLWNTRAVDPDDSAEVARFGGNGR
jgi:hypothetical protein